jgi:acyl-CoA reductase-like NAD-dependent aldehyde dehydrogenase
MDIIHAAAPGSRQFSHHIDGQDVASAAGGTFQSFNPTTGENWGLFAAGKREDVAQAVQAAQGALAGAWGRLSPTRRGRLMMRWGDVIREHAENIAEIETAQNGKLLAETSGQAKGLQDWLYYFGGLADKIEGKVIPLERTSILNYTLRERLGVIGIITPWNSPALLTIMAAAPALAAGNTIVIKPSEVASASVLEIAKLAKEAGMPPGAINVVTGLRETGEALVNHPGIAKIAFTGSVETGRWIAERAGSRLASCTLELGGKSPTVVFADADLKQAEAGILGGIFAAAGQTCVAGSRAYIQQPVYDHLVERLVKRAKGIILGDPRQPGTQFGPVATVAQLQKDERMVTQAVASGAEVACGGKRREMQDFPGGYFFEPTILHRVQPENPIMRNEVFGPVLSVVPFGDEDEAIQLANDSEFGLAAGVWTLDVRRAHRIARAMQSGTVWINMYRALAFNSPFGGYKQSGIGTQNGMESIYQYLRTKSIWCELSSEYADAFAPTAEATGAAVNIPR